MADLVAAVFVVQVQGTVKLLGVRVEQQFVMVEAMADLRFVRSGNTIAVQSARPQTRYVAVPDLIGVFGQNQPLDLALARRVEQAEFDLFGMGGEKREVDALAIPVCAERIRFAWPHAGT